MHLFSGLRPGTPISMLIFPVEAMGTLLALLLFLPLPSVAGGELLFRDIAPEAGIVEPHLAVNDCYPHIATGSAWADVDNDGDVDLYVTHYEGPNRFYLNAGPGFPNFVEVAAVYGVDLPEVISNGVVFVDYDNDGDQDLYVLNLYGNNLFANQLMEQGSLGFVDVTATAGIGDGGRAVTAAWGDLDADGLLDLYIVKHMKCRFDGENQDHLFHNNGDGTFTDVCHWLCGGSPTCAQLEGTGFSAGWVDYDNDGDADLYVANDAIEDNYHNVLWRNDGSDENGGWVFTDVSDFSGTGIEINSMGLGVGDYDNDGWFDFAVSGINEKALLRNLGNGTFDEVAREANIQMPPGITWGTVFFDVTNDGWEELYFTVGTISPNPGAAPDMLYGNNGDGTFTDISLVSGIDDSGYGRGASIVDINSDGLVDVMITNLYEVPKLFLNQSQDPDTAHHWLTVTVEGTVSNRDGIGTRLTLTRPDSMTMMREITSGPTHGGGDYRAAFFGLGIYDNAFLSVRWPRGFSQEIGPVAANRHLHLVEPTPTGAGSGSLFIPSKHLLTTNYPNPFNTSTTIRYEVRSRELVVLSVFDLLGREVDVLVNETMAPGSYQVTWDATSNASGVYFYRIRTSDFLQSHRLLLMK
jgi:hypothetical protein